MKRQTKYSDTTTFHFYNANPKNRITGDCCFRAMATALEQDYNQTVMEMAELMCKTGYALNDSKGEDRYLATKGWIKHPQPKKPDGTKYTGKEFCKELPYLAHIHGNIIAHVGGHHIICIKEVKCDDGVYRYKVHDIWDSTDKCVGNYWTKGSD